MRPAPIRVYLIDDHLSLLQLLALRIQAAPDLQLAGASTDGRNAEEILQTQPHVIVMDLELPGRGAFDLAEEIRASRSDLKLMFFTGYLSDLFIARALQVGAWGYLLKGESVDMLIEGIRRVAAGEFCFSAEVQERIRFHSESGRYTVKAQSELNALTSRQLEVLRHLARGASVKEIARSMRLSEKSVDSHKYRIMARLGIHDRVELARFAIREGLTLP